MDNGTKTSRPATHLLMLSYHFFPSREIGARRVTALARYLAANNCIVHVVSEFGGGEIAERREVEPGIFGYYIVNPRPLVMGLMVRAKRFLRGADRIPDSTSDNTAQPQTAGKANRQLSHFRKWATQLRKWYFSKVFFVDSHKRWSWRASEAAVDIGRASGVSAVLTSGPPFSGVLAAARAARILKVPLIADYRDPWTDFDPHVPTDPHGFDLWLMRRLERRVVMQAAAVTSTGEKVARLLADHYGIAARTHVIRNGFDGEATPPLENTSHRLSILFAGELYVRRNPFPLLEALERLLARKDVRPDRIEVVFMGKCSSFGHTQLADWLAGKRAERVVTIFPPMPADSVREAARNATVLLNFAHLQPLSVPAKTFEHLASGRELLLLSEDGSETSMLVAGMSGVTQVDPSSGERLDAVLADLYQRHVVEGCLRVPDAETVQRHSRAYGNRQFLEIIQGLTAERTARR